MTDITILTQQSYLNPQLGVAYTDNIVQERNLIMDALRAKGLTVEVTNWDNPDYNWSQTRAVVFRTIWDYFERYDEFEVWMENTRSKTQFINSFNLVKWNIDKHYLTDLEKAGIAIVPTVFVDKDKYLSIDQVCKEKGWSDVVIKPAIAGGAFHTHKVLENERDQYEELFKKLVSERDMLIQPFIKSIASRGEASLMVFNGEYTHAILKKAKKGDYRVQDDWGGTVHDYEPSEEEIAFAKACFAACPSLPAYGRADILWDEDGSMLLGEIEVIEPELWIRHAPESAERFAKGILVKLA